MITTFSATTSRAIELDLTGLAIGLTIVLAVGVVVLVALLWRAASSTDPHVFASDDEVRARVPARPRLDAARQTVAVDD